MRRAAVERDAWKAMTPALVLLGVVSLWPLAQVLWMSLHERSVFGTGGFVGAQHFRRLMEDGRWWNALGNTLYFTIVSVSLELILGLVCALMLVKIRRGRVWVYAALLLPWVIPTVVSARMWEWMYQAETGVLNHVLGSRTNWLGDPVWALHAAIVMDIWKSTPFVTLLLVAGLQGISPDLYRAAAVDGAGPWTCLRRITLPMLMPVILVTVVFRTIDALRVFDSLYVLTGGGPADTTESLSVYAYKTLFQTLDFGYGSALSVAMLLIAGLVTAVYARLLRGADS